MKIILITELSLGAQSDVTVDIPVLLTVTPVIS